MGSGQEGKGVKVSWGHGDGPSHTTTWNTGACPPAPPTHSGLISVSGFGSQIRAAQTACFWEKLRKTGWDRLILKLPTHPPQTPRPGMRAPVAASPWRAKCENRLGSGGGVSGLRRGGLCFPGCPPGVPPRPSSWGPSDRAGRAQRTQQGRLLHSHPFTADTSGPQM